MACHPRCGHWTQCRACEEIFAVPVPTPTQKFYMVYVEASGGGSGPSVRHIAQREAMEEAKRLATRLHKRTYVLEATMSCAPADNVVWTPTVDNHTP